MMFLVLVFSITAIVWVLAVCLEHDSEKQAQEGFENELKNKKLAGNE